MKKLLFILFPVFAFGQTVKVVNPVNPTVEPITLGIHHDMLPNEWPILAQRQTGTVTSWTWSIVSGAGASITGSDSIATFSYPGEGFYVVRCTVNGGSFDDVTIRVINALDKGVAAECRNGAPVVHIIPSTTSNTLSLLNLSATYDIKGGDTIKIPKRNSSQPYYRIITGGFGGRPECWVTVVPNITTPGDTSQAVKWGGEGYGSGGTQWYIGSSDSLLARYVYFKGDYMGVDYGFQSDYATYPSGSPAFGLVSETFAHVKASGFYLKNVTNAFKLKGQSDSTKIWKTAGMMSFKTFEHFKCYIKETGNEGDYLGSTTPQGETQVGIESDGPNVRFDTVLVHHNIFDGGGWDGYQTSNSRYNEFHDNIVLNSARLKRSSQEYMTVFGGNTTGKFYNNFLQQGRWGSTFTSYDSILILRNVVQWAYGRGRVRDSANQYQYVCKTTHTAGATTEPGVGASWQTYWFRYRVTGWDDQNFPMWASGASYSGGSGVNSIYVSGGTANLYEAPYISPAAARIEGNIIPEADSFAIRVTGSSRASIVRNNVIVHPFKTTQASVIASVSGSTISGNTIIPELKLSVRNLTTKTGPFQFEVSDNGTPIDTVSTADSIIRIYEWYVTGDLENVPPTANAGTDKAIQLPTNNVLLVGSESDIDGGVSSRAWTQVSGPNTATIVSAGSISTTVTGLIEGTYVFRLTVTDTDSATATDDVTVTVYPAKPRRVEARGGVWIFRR